MWHWNLTANLEVNWKGKTTSNYYSKWPVYCCSSSSWWDGPMQICLLSPLGICEHYWFPACRCTPGSCPNQCLCFRLGAHHLSSFPFPFFFSFHFHKKEKRKRHAPNGKCRKPEGQWLEHQSPCLEITEKFWYIESKFLQRNLNWKLLHRVDPVQVLQALMASVSKSHVLGPFSSREWTESSKIVNSQAAHRVGVGAYTVSIDFSVPVVLNHLLTETDQQASKQSIEI